MGAWMNGRVHRYMDMWMDGEVGRWVSGQSARTGRWMDECLIDGCVDGWLDVSLGGRMDG